jgi:hypothetical protein
MYRRCTLAGILRKVNTSNVQKQRDTRFGPLSPDTRLRLQDATPEQLERWADRILDAQRLDDVFAEGEP